MPVVAWAVLLAGLAYVAYVRAPATDNEQTTIGRALPTVDAALGAVASAVSALPVRTLPDGSLPSGSLPDGVRPLLALGGYLPVDRRCPITPIRDGVRYQRVLDLYLRPSGERTLLAAIAARLPRRYGGAVSRSDPPTLAANAGNFIAVRASVSEPGHIRVTADTGCRAAEGTLSVLAPLTPPQARAPIARLLGISGPAGVPDAGGITWRGYRIDCPGQEPLSTVEADLRMSTPPTAPVGAFAYSGRQGYAYRDGDAAMVVRAGSDALTVSATVGCGG